MLLDSEALCMERARSLCASLKHSGPMVMGLALMAYAYARTQWKLFRERQAAEKDRLAAEEKARLADEKLAAVKAQRNEHAERAQRLEVKVASLRPPPMVTGQPVTLELEDATTLPPPGRPSLPPLETRGSPGDSEP